MYAGEPELRQHATAVEEAGVERTAYGVAVEQSLLRAGKLAAGEQLEQIEVGEKIADVELRRAQRSVVEIDETDALAAPWRSRSLQRCSRPQSKRVQTPAPTKMT